MSKRFGLSAQLFFDVVRSLLVGCAVFFLLWAGGTYALSRTIYGDAFSKKLADRQFEQLQAYVLREQVTPENLRPLDVWCRQEQQVYLVLYLQDRFLYESPLSADLTYSPEEFEAANYSPNLEDPDREYTLLLSDQTPVRAFLYSYVQDSYYYWAMALAGLTAFLVFSLCFIALVHRKLRYIQRLKAELDILAGGDLTCPVTVQGRDELGELAAGIDQMRRSIVAHQAAEEQMRTANSQLVTAMSHDLRTPLTSLLAYLELMERGKYEDQEQLSHFIRRSLDKTLQIKSMADKLFEYFLVYSSEWEPLELESADGDAFLRHLLGEYAFSLENGGFTVSQTYDRRRSSRAIPRVPPIRS